MPPTESNRPGGGIDLITKVRKNIKPMVQSAFGQALLKRCSLVETVIDELKNLCQIEHARHGSVANCIINLMTGINAYCLMPNKPHLPVMAAESIGDDGVLIQN